jgi:hypothetical protein
MKLDALSKKMLRTYRSILEELTPAERRAIAVLCLLLALGIAAKFLRRL